MDNLTSRYSKNRTLTNGDKGYLASFELRRPEVVKEQDEKGDACDMLFAIDSHIHRKVPC